MKGGFSVWGPYLRILLSLFVGLIVFGSSEVWAEYSSLMPVPFSALNDSTVFERDIWKNRHDLLSGIEDNILFLDSERGDTAYQRASGRVDQKRVRESLTRFRYLLLTSETSEEFRHALQREFKLYRSVGSDGSGTVKFTGYFQPSYKASRTRSEEYRYPIYKAPADFAAWSKPHPTRVTLEGYQGMGTPVSPLWGGEIAWLKSRFEAFMIHVQGSAILEYPDGAQSAVGFACGTDYPFRGVPQTFLDQHQVAWSNLPAFFGRNPDLLDQVLARNNRYILFKEMKSPAPIGSIGVPVMAERSIATDKSFLPPGALGIIRANMPEKDPSGRIRLTYTSRFVLDQDTGSAIRGPGRVDLFMGSGEEAQVKANMMYSSGELYYFLLNRDA